MQREYPISLNGLFLQGHREITIEDKGDCIKVVAGLKDSIDYLVSYRFQDFVYAEVHINDKNSELKWYKDMGKICIVDETAKERIKKGFKIEESHSAD